jgi:hypothetical protein
VLCWFSLFFFLFVAFAWSLAVLMVGDKQKLSFPSGEEFVVIARLQNPINRLSS